MSLVWNEIGVRERTDQATGAAVRTFGHRLESAQHMQRSRPIKRSDGISSTAPELTQEQLGP